MNKFHLLLLLTVVSYSQLSSQFTPPRNWHMMDYEQDGQWGVSADKSYGDILKDRTAQPVIVAVLDSGVDYDHEDLAANIWINHDEIPGNGLDDDQNGYIDDIHGWNFIGGKTEDIHHETLEVTRLYASMRDKYENVDISTLNKKETEEYSKFVLYKEEVETKRKSSLKKIGQYEMAKQAYNITLNAAASYLGSDFITQSQIDTMSTNTPDLELAKTILSDILVSNSENGISIDTILRYVNMDLNAALQEERVTVDFQYNPDFDAREIIGDNYEDQEERYYGNNRVEGPDALHGTHVAGLIAAIRNNDIGMNGIATNVRIMVLRVVPDGDERDKDVANAIRYAVDNGASIINMSFGKGKSWNKKVVDDAVYYAAKKDVLMIHASGNGSLNTDNELNYPNDTYEKARGFLFWKKKQAKPWIEVGALNFLPGDYMVAPFSNYGSNSVDIFAPGTAIYSTVPNDEYQELQGTSFASPITAGVAAVLRSYFPKLKAEQVKSIIMESATKINRDVIVPGTNERLAFKELCVSGGVLNMYDAILLANKTKGKKKIKKSKPKA